MKAIWYEPGDPSVGMDGGFYTIDLGDFTPNSLNHRECVRESLAQLYLQMYGEIDYPQFSDECGDCCKPMENGLCMNQRCIMNAPPEYFGGSAGRFDV